MYDRKVVIHMDHAVKHLEKLRKEIDFRLGKGKGDEILRGLDELTGNESPQEIAKWAETVTAMLESAIPDKDLIPIREACACIKANKYSAYNKNIFLKSGRNTQIMKRRI